MTKEAMHAQSRVKADEGRLPDELAAKLEPQLLRALSNPCRREILRVLHRDIERPRSVKEIASGLTDFTVDDVHYHACVLEEPKAIVVANTGLTLDGDGRFYVSRVAEHPHVLAVLRATQQYDKDRMRKADRHSQRLLTIFRVPRPAIAIRLGARLKRTS